LNNTVLQLYIDAANDSKQEINHKIKKHKEIENQIGVNEKCSKPWGRLDEY